MKIPTINEMLIAAIAYRNPNNSLLQNIQTLIEIWTVFRKHKKEMIEAIQKDNYKP